MKFLFYLLGANIANMIKNYLVEIKTSFVYIVLLSFLGSFFSFMFMNCILEWKIHNKAYEWGLKRDSTCDCDFNKDDEGKGWIQFIWDGFTK